MATVKAFIRTTKSEKNNSVNIRFRLSDGRIYSGGIQLFHKSDITIRANQWDEKLQKVKARCLIDEKQRFIIDKSISDRKEYIKEIYLSFGKSLTSEQLDLEIDKYLNPDKYKIVKRGYFEVFEEFLQKHPISEVRKKNYRVVLRALKRFELYMQSYVKEQTNFYLDIDTVNVDTLNSFEKFLRNEFEYFTKYPELYKSFPEKRANEPRGSNTISGIFTKMRTFTNWTIKNGLTTNNPFNKFNAPTEVYGTPYLLTIEEKNKLYYHDFSNNKSLEKQRDIFVFQCSIGCRAGDLFKLKKINIISDAVEYIASKTKDEKPKTIRVPLNKIAKEVVAKYSDLPGEQLLPFISVQRYNDAIKTCLTYANITRLVTVLNPLTRESEIKPINEVASSHLARRTFVGNLFKMTKESSLVGNLSGHAENSKAFARYRNIDEDMKKELVNMLD